ncbi:UDP-xylose and UDP-N-acetylglucosamine transporter [Tribolium castaneum]|uniref:UDP-xylose and UDP-N-acetylglucosamine transporter-like Protein n=1 Tax=Tribolium castaneum TaxID=7070 RepID=D7EIK0_TRICA|nr:PREDICTED: UDP-xylose and UDP-N-acetylglucosamine transporter [Tribolium castaneum]EFA12028.1 UDP-xylose and UDP-N-acetylglucosamine transporter-like Protein [Tribolium castaneum]|eukprot:XP_008199832.1 PREDICTED: UDP-xylose and UDP-N-acetylglucosamine transporter [Tribolium castaneum]
MNSKAVAAIATTLLGCGLNNVFLEYIIKQDPGCGHLITFAQFLFISIHGFVMTSKFGTVTPKIPFQTYLILVVLFFLTSVINNWAFNFNIPVPLHMIFRAGSLIANMIMGILILKKRYTLEKYVSVAMITLGIIICTLMSSGNKKVEACVDCDIQVEKKEADDHFFWWIIGIALLTGALLLSARMGIYQESIYKHYGKHPQEALYYTHLYSLPGFLIYSPSIWQHMQIASQSEPYEIPIVNTIVPMLWLWIVLNVVTQYLCISSVYVLTTECTSLTVTLVITLRKFLSLIFSIVYFQNPFTIYHWFGTALVFFGTLLFAEVFTKLKQSNAEQKASKSVKKTS